MLQELDDFLWKKYQCKITDEEVELDDVLEIRGQDGIDFIEDFFSYFDIPIDYFPYKDYIYPEGFSLLPPWSVIKSFISRRPLPKMKPLKYKHLEACIRNGYWSYFD